MVALGFLTRIPVPSAVFGDARAQARSLAWYPAVGLLLGALLASLAWLLRDGPRTLWLSVWSENPGAQRFYARYGFAFAGEYAFIVGAQRDREFMYRRPAQP